MTPQRRAPCWRRWISRFISSRVSHVIQTAFWEGLDDDLDIMARDAPLLVGIQGAAALVAVVAAAQSAVDHYLVTIASSAEKPVL